MTPTLITLFISPDGLYGMSTRFMLNMFAGPNKFVDLRYAWRCWTVKGGTNAWIRNMVTPFREKIKVNSGVQRVSKAGASHKTKVEVTLDDGTKELFDHAILTNGGQAAALLVVDEEKGWMERTAFSMIRYAPERVVLHTDQSFVPEDPANRRCFNYVYYKGMKEPQLTGLLGEVSHQPRVDPEPILTMNPTREPENIVHERWCSVHVQDLQHMIAVRVLMPNFQGDGNVWYAGSWVNFLGHSGGVDAGSAAAVRIGARYPLKGDICKKEFFANCCFDMFGPRFDWETSVRKNKPIIQAGL